MSTEWTLAKWHPPAPPDGMRSELAHRVAWNAKPEDYQCVILAGAGLCVAAISARTGLSPGQIHYRLAKWDVRITDYRQGRGPIARAILENSTRLVAGLLEKKLRALPAINGANQH